MAEIDTGPGLETQFSWDYSHSIGSLDAPAGNVTKQDSKFIAEKRAPEASVSPRGETFIILARS